MKTLKSRLGIAMSAIAGLTMSAHAVGIDCYESTILVDSPTTWDWLAVRVEDRQNTSASPSFWYRTFGTVTVNAPLTVVSSIDVRGAATATYGSQTLAAAGGIVNLVGGTLATGVLNLTGPGVINQSGGAYSVEQLNISGSVTLNYGPNDAISKLVYVDRGAVLSLAKNLSLSQDIRIGMYGGPATIRTNGRHVSLGGRLELDDNAVIDRTSGGSLAANWFTVEASALEIRPGDVFNPTPGTNYVHSGGSVAYSGGSMPGALQVAGTSSLARSTFIANAPLQVADLNVFSNGVFTQNSSVTVSSTSGGWTAASVSAGGVLGLNSGTLTTPMLSLSGSGSIVQAGGAYTAASVSLSSGAQLRYTSVDRTTSSLSVTGSGSQLIQQAPLSISSLSLSSGGRLLLSGFSGTGGLGSWALRLSGDWMYNISGYMGSALISSSNAPGTVVAVYDQAENSTFVTANITTAVVADVPAYTTRTGSQVMYPQIATGGSLRKTGAGTLLLDQANTLTGSTTVGAGRIEIAHPLALGSSRLVPLVGGTVILSPGLQTTVGGLAANAGGLLDVGAGIVTVAAGLSASDLVASIMTGMGDGGWNGSSGIVSSVAAGGDGSRSVGWLDNGDGSLSFGFAAVGDTNLDWLVDALDLANFLGSGKFDAGDTGNWQEGDFNYDELVDVLDVAGFLSTGLFDVGFYNGSASAAVAVPEPSTYAMALAGAGCAGCSMWLRRKRA